jgi:hypothetical protein
LKRTLSNTFEISETALWLAILLGAFCFLRTQRTYKFGA